MNATVSGPKRPLRRGILAVLLCALVVCLLKASIEPLLDWAQLGGMIRLFEDARGNRDGVIGNEDLPPEQLAGPVHLWTAYRDLVVDAWVGFPAHAARARLEQEVSGLERTWGQKVSSISMSTPERDLLFRAEKAASLLRFGRRPAEVEDAFIQARGSVEGTAVAPRRLFVQHWRPLGPPTGRFVVVVSGYRGDGRNFFEQIQLINQRGDDALVFDQQWLGYSDGHMAELDSVQGIARDTAAAAAFAQELARETYGARAEPAVFYAVSMGAGSGVLEALVANDHGRLALEGPAMPRGMDCVLGAPYLTPTPNLMNRFYSAVLGFPGFRSIRAYPLLFPGSAPHNPVAAEKALEHFVRDRTEVMISAIGRTTAELTALRARIARGERPLGRAYLLHPTGDIYADPETSRWLAAQLGDRAKLDLFPGIDHVFHETPGDQARFLRGFDWLLGTDAASAPIR